MKMNWKSIAISAAVALGLGAISAWAIQTNYLGTVFIADSTVPSRQLTDSAAASTSKASAASAPARFAIATRSVRRERVSVV